MFHFTVNFLQVICITNCTFFIKFICLLHCTLYHGLNRVQLKNVGISDAIYVYFSCNQACLPGNKFVVTFSVSQIHIYGFVNLCYMLHYMCIETLCGRL